MKKTTKFWLCPFIAIGLVLVFNNSCKKDDLKIDPIITWENPTDISFGTLLSAIQLNATADVPGTFIYTPPAGTKLSVGTNQDLKVDFTPTDATTYNSASKTVKINVTASVKVTDIEGNVYNTVTIGTQVWMAENLKTTKYRNGDPIPNVTDATKWGNLSTGAYCNYDNTSGNGTIYGKLYNWYAVDDSRNIAPTGWHVPTDEEWIILENYLIANGYNWDGTKDENKIAKALASTTNWASSSNEGAIGKDLTKNNSTGFTALPGGYRGYSGTFYNVGYGDWWSSTESNTLTAYYLSLFYNFSNLGSNQYGVKGGGFSVRCLKDN